MAKRVSDACLNIAADAVVSGDVRVYLNSDDPGANGTANRLAAGGANYTGGVLVAAAGFTNAASGDVWNVAAVNFGAASAAAGTPTHYSVFRESGSVFLWAAEIESADQVAIDLGDSYSINIGGVRLNGAQAS